MSRTLTAAAALVCMVTSPTIAGITPDACGPTLHVHKWIDSQGQVIIGVGESRDERGTLLSTMMVTVHPETGAWSLFYSNDGKTMCAAFHGVHWTSVTEPSGVDS